MTSLGFAILASSSDSLIIKFVVFVVIAILWGIGALAKLAKKQSEDARRARTAREAALLQEMDLRRRPQAARPAPRGRVAPLAPPPLPAALQQQAIRRPMPMVTPGQRKLRRRPGVAPSPAAQVPLDVQVVLTEIGQGTLPASPARRDAQARPLVQLNAGNLRQQILLSEILQPPVALRE
jgi:hypothetical protein